MILAKNQSNLCSWWG